MFHEARSVDMGRETYEKPVIRDYGDLFEQTASGVAGNQSDGTFNQGSIGLDFGAVGSISLQVLPANP